MVRKVIATLIFIAFITSSFTQDLHRVDTVIVHSGNLKLKGLLWHPDIGGKLPTIIFCHGSYETGDTRYDAVEDISSIGPLFAKHGYIFLGLLRRGVGLSRGQGENSADLMAKAFEENGQEGRNRIQLQQLETDQLDDMIAGLDFLRKRNDVDKNRIAVVGHSFGGSLALVLAEHDPSVRAVINFSSAGYSWDRSPQLRNRLIEAVKNISAPIMMLQAKNDYSLHPGYALDSMMSDLHKPHVLKIYPEFGKSDGEAHNLIFLGTTIWEKDVFQFLGRLTKH